MFNSAVTNAVTSEVGRTLLTQEDGSVGPPCSLEAEVCACVFVCACVCVAL